MKFYIAASMEFQEEAKDIAHRVSRYAKEWVCGSRWIFKKPVSSGFHLKVAAIEDFDDLKEASALVFVHPGVSTSGGKYVEMGIALALEIPIIYYSPDRRNSAVNRPIFYHLPQVRKVRSIVGISDLLEEIGINLKKKPPPPPS